MGFSFGDIEPWWAGCTMMGVWQGQVDVGLVPGLSYESSALFCWGSGAHWGLHFRGSIPQCGALGTLVDGEGVRESGVSLACLDLPMGISSRESSV